MYYCVELYALQYLHCFVSFVNRYCHTFLFVDPSDIDLRHALANMIAVVFALPSHSNHIWYHMFCPGELEDSYMTGFMVMPCVQKVLFREALFFSILIQSKQEV